MTGDVPVPAGELAAFGTLMEQTEAALAALRAERDDAVALAAEILGTFSETPDGHSGTSAISVVSTERYGRWRETAARHQCERPDCGTNAEWGAPSRGEHDFSCWANQHGVHAAEDCECWCHDEANPS